VNSEESQKHEIETLRNLLEQNTETLQRMESFLHDLNNRLEATGEALSGKRSRPRPDFSFYQSPEEENGSASPP